MSMLPSMSLSRRIESAVDHAHIGPRFLVTEYARWLRFVLFCFLLTSPCPSMHRVCAPVLLSRLTASQLSSYPSISPIALTYPPPFCDSSFRSTPSLSFLSLFSLSLFLRLPGLIHTPDDADIPLLCILPISLFSSFSPLPSFARVVCLMPEHNFPPPGFYFCPNGPSTMSSSSTTTAPLIIQTYTLRSRRYIQVKHTRIYY